MTYRNNHKPQNIIQIDFSNVHPKHLEGFIQGVKAVKAAKETSMTYRNNDKPQNIILIDVSNIHWKHLEGFVQGVKAAKEAIRKNNHE